MDDNLRAIEVALRVLKAYREGRPPAAADEECLRLYAPSLRDNTIDEVACAVIQQQLVKRKPPDSDTFRPAQKIAN